VPRQRFGPPGVRKGSGGTDVSMTFKLIVVIVPVLCAFAATAVKDYYSNCMGHAVHMEKESWEVTEMGDTEVRCADYNHVLNWYKSPDGKFVVNSIIFTFVFFMFPVVMNVYNYFKSINLVETDLHRAAEKGDLPEVLNQINKKKAFVMALDPERDTCLHKAAINGQLTVVKTLLELEDGMSLLFSRNKHGWTAMHLAATAGDLEMVQALAEKGQKDIILMRDRRAQTPFLLAAYQGHIDVLEVLLEKGGKDQLQNTNDTGGSAMHYACIGNRPKAVKWLSEVAGQDMLVRVDHEESTCMHKAAELGYLDVVKAVLAVQGGERTLEMREKVGTTPFHKACEAGRLQVVQFLLELTDDECLNPKDSRGFTCLHFASMGGHAEVCAELLERGGVDLLNDRDSLMISPMDNALQAKHEAVLEVMKKWATPESSGPQYRAMFNAAFGIKQVPADSPGPAPEITGDQGKSDVADEDSSSKSL